jgi:predicted house-cleaning noncanonical NTP pyrophosphatase (MazG superfamily)
MPDSTISKTFGVGELAAVNIRNAKPEQLINSDKICPQHIKEIKHKKYKCRYSEEKCPNCLKEFLESEVEETNG